MVELLCSRADLGPAITSKKELGIVDVPVWVGLVFSQETAEGLLAIHSPEKPTRPGGN